MIFVTGGTGLIGAQLLLDLVRSGASVSALKRASSNLSVVESVFDQEADGKSLFAKINWVDGDITDYFFLLEQFKEVEKVYHCAAVVSFLPTDREELAKVNIDGTSNVVNACMEAGVKKLCYVSSTAAVGKGSDGTLIDEESEWDPKKIPSWYALTKFMAEREVWRAYAEGLDVVMVNPGIVIGPGQWGKSSTNFFPSVWKGMKYYTKGTNGFVDVRDVSRAMTELMDSDISGERFLLVGENIEYKKFLTLVANALNKKPPTQLATSLMSGIAWRVEWARTKVFGGNPLVTEETARSAQKNIRYSSEKIKKMLGFEFTSLQSAVDRTASLFLKDSEQNQAK